MSAPDAALLDAYVEVIRAARDVIALAEHPRERDRAIKFSEALHRYHLAQNRALAQQMQGHLL